MIISDDFSYCISKISWSSWWWRWLIHSILTKCQNHSTKCKLFALDIKKPNPWNFASFLSHYCVAIYRELNGMLFVLVFLSSGLRNIFCLSFFSPRAKTYMFLPRLDVRESYSVYSIFHCCWIFSMNEENRFHACDSTVSHTLSILYELMISFMNISQYH